MDELEYGKTYLIWRDGEFIGEATWTKDDNVGDSFLAKELINDQEVNMVYFADSWVEKNQNDDSRRKNI